MKSICLFGLFLLLSCHYEKAGKTTSLGSVFKEGVESKTQSKSSQIEQGVLEGAIGLITTSENYQFGDTIFVFDDEY
jgi:hypothetical protein